MRTRYMLAAAFLAATATACTTDATGPIVIDDPWEGTLAAGKALEIKGINGRIVAGPASGEVTHVSFAKRGTDDDPNDVRIDVINIESEMLQPKPVQLRRSAIVGRSFRLR